MRIKMWCNAHKCRVVSAGGTDLHWIPIDARDGEVDEFGRYSEWELDKSSLYCTSDVGSEHEFCYTLEV